MHRLLTTLCRQPCLLAATAALVLAGRGSPPRLPAVPGALQYEAVVPGMPNVRCRQPQVDALLKGRQRGQSLGRSPGSGRRQPWL